LLRNSYSIDLPSILTHIKYKTKTVKEIKQKKSMNESSSQKSIFEQQAKENELVFCRIKYFVFSSFYYSHL